MRRALRVLAVSVGAAALVLSGTAVASAHGTSPMSYRCAGGEIPSGNYASVIVTGQCAVAADAVISVAGDVWVAGGAALDAQSAPSTITIGRDVIAGPGSILGLGCQPTNTIGMFAGVPCAAAPAGHTTITIGGNVTAIGADTVLLRGAVAAGAGKLTVGGNVTLIGGGNRDNPWSIKGTSIGRNLTIIGVTAEFLGVQFNTVGGNATLLNIKVYDVDSPPPGVTIVENTVARNLTCFGLAPGVSGGFIPGEVNHVSGRAIGQCAALV